MFEEKMTVETPEHVSLEFEIAGPFTRVTALLVDLVILAGVVLVVVLLLILFVSSGFTVGQLAGDWAAAVGYLAFNLLVWGYFPVMELLMDGQTPGKRAAGIRVARVDAAPLDARTILLRNALRLVDMQPAPLHTVGLVSMILTRRGQRLGDLVAGTWVLRERRRSPRRPADSARARDPFAAATGALPAEPGRLTREEHRLIDQFLERRRTLDPEVRREVARKIALPIARRLGVDRSPGGTVDVEGDPESFLREEHRRGIGRSLV